MVSACTCTVGLDIYTWFSMRKWSSFRKKIIAYYLLFLPGAIAVSNGLFSDRNVRPSIGDVQCLGTESELLNCSYSNNSPDSSCVERDDAGVACQGIGLIVLPSGEYIYW